MENYGVDGICLSSYSLDLCLSISVFESVWRTTRIMVMMMMMREKKKKRGLGTKGGWSESHAVVKTCLCINSFKNATPLPMAACSSYA